MTFILCILPENLAKLTKRVMGTFCDAYLNSPSNYVRFWTYLDVRYLNCRCDSMKPLHTLVASESSSNLLKFFWGVGEALQTYLISFFWVERKVKNLVQHLW